MGDLPRRTHTDAGAGNDRWVSTPVARNCSGPQVGITRAPHKPQEETAGETVTGEGNTTAADVNDSRSAIVATAKASLTAETGYRYYSQAGDLTDQPIPGPPYRSDCSQWVRAIYLRVGMPDPGTTTFEQASKGNRTSKPQPGDILIANNCNHVEIYIGGGKSIGHGNSQIREHDVSVFRDLEYYTFNFLPPCGDSYTKARGTPN